MPAVMPTTATAATTRPSTTKAATRIAPGAADANRHPPEHDRFGALAGRWLEAGNDFARDAALDQALDVLEEGLLVQADQ